MIGIGHTVQGWRQGDDRGAARHLQTRFDTDALQGSGRRPPPQSPLSMALGDADPGQTGTAELQLNQVSAYSALCQIRTLAEDKWEALARYSDRLA